MHDSAFRWARRKTLPLIPMVVVGSFIGALIGQTIRGIL